MNEEKINTIEEYKNHRISGDLCICAKVKRLNDSAKSMVFITTSIEPIDCTGPIESHNHDIKCKAYQMICNFLFAERFKSDKNYYNLNNELELTKTDKKPTCAY